MTTYTIPDGVSLGEVLFSQFPGEQIAATDDQIVLWPESLGPKPTQQQVTTWAANVPAWRLSQLRSATKARLRDNHPDRVLLRAVVKVLMNSLVEARTTINSLRTAMTDATSFADLKTRATAVTALTNRNWQQALAAAEAVIDAGHTEE